LKIKKDFEENLDRLKLNLLEITKTQIEIMTEDDAKKYYFENKLGLNYDKMKQALSSIHEQANLFILE
jgi:hypothetical protein